MLKNIKEIEEIAVSVEPRSGGALVRFNNNYGASVIYNRNSYGFEEGLFELAVVKFTELHDRITWNITYETPITADVIGFLTEDEVLDILKEIKEL